MIRAALSAALLALSALPAFAQGTMPNTAVPQLKRDVTVSGDLVRVGDLFTNAGAAAATPLFRAPDLGETGVLPARQVLDAALAHGLVLVDAGDVMDVSVTRAARVIAADAIRARISESLTARYPLGDPKSLKITFDRDLRAITLDPGVTAELSVARLAYDAGTRRFDLTFEMVDGAGRRTWRYLGTAVETVEVAVLARALARGEVVRAADITIERRPKTEVANEALAPAVEVAGLAAKRALRAGQPLRTSDLTKPEIVQRNDMVMLQFIAPGIVLTMRGQAMDGGAEGDTISVLNAQSKRTVQGVITAPGRVTVTSARIAARTDEPQR